MFFFKALFVRIGEWIAFCVSLWALWQATQGDWLWLAPLLAWAPMGIINQWRLRRGNLAFHDEREVLALTAALLGLAAVLIAGERNYLLWWTLAGLFNLLLNTVLMSKLSRGVREPSGDRRLLASLTFTDTQGRSVSASSARLLVFVHSGWSPYSVMQLRDLEKFLLANSSVKPQSVALVFSGLPPTHWRPLSSLQALGVEVWGDCDGEACQRLGLWLRGASVLRRRGGDALRPTMAVLPSRAAVDAGRKPSSAEDVSEPSFWSMSNNVRLPPSATQHQARLLALLAS